MNLNSINLNMVFINFWSDDWNKIKVTKIESRHKKSIWIETEAEATEAENSKCPSCWTANDEGVCEFDASAQECFTQTCNNGAMQLNINFKNLFNSDAADLGEYSQEIGLDDENWPSLGVKNLTIYLAFNFKAYLTSNF